MTPPTSPLLSSSTPLFTPQAELEGLTRTISNEKDPKGKAAKKDEASGSSKDGKKAAKDAKAKAPAKPATIKAL